MSKAKKPESVAQILARKGKTKTKKKTAPKKAVKRGAKKPKKGTRANTKKTVMPKALEGSVVGLRNPAGYLEFIDYMVTPKPLRTIKKQGEFAKKIGVHETTLSDWKKRVGFWDDVKQERDNLIKGDDLSTAIYYLNKKIASDCTASDVKLLFEIAGEYVAKSEVQAVVPMRELSVERKEAILKRLGKWEGKTI